MNKYEVFEAISKSPVFYLATVEDNQPRVRGMLLYKADESGITFHTSSKKDLYRQIMKNNKAELCFSCNGIQIRINGELELVDDNNLKEEIFAHPTRAFLQPMRAMPDFLDIFAVFRLKNGTAVTWTMETNFAPKEPIRL